MSPGVQGQPGQHSKTLFKNNSNKKIPTPNHRGVSFEGKNSDLAYNF
jgi:hypothetical protein